MPMVHFLKDNILNFHIPEKTQLDLLVSFNGNIFRILSTIYVDNNTNMANALERCSGRNK